MKRRAFIKLVAGAAAMWPLAARAQNTGPLIGFLRSSSLSDSTSLVAAFRQGLEQAGYIENQNVAIEYRWADERQSELPKLAAELVGLHVAAIVANQVAVPAAKAATSTIPIVMVTGADPVAAGLVKSLRQPGGNITGVSFFDIPLAEKRLELLHTLVPKAQVIAALLDSKFSQVQTEINELNGAAQKLEQKIVIVKTDRSKDLDASFAMIAQAGAGAMLMGAGPYLRSEDHRLVQLAAQHAIPAIYPHRESAADGGLLSYAASQTDAYRRAGVYVARILKGEKPSELPIELPTKYELAVNLKTAKSLGINIPPSLLATADEVIE